MSNPDLLPVLTREGVLISVSVRYWRGCAKLRPQDLGLEPGAVSDRLIHLGRKRLVPKEAMAKLALVESRAHALVEGNTFPFLNGLAHFLPNAKLVEVTDGLAELETEFEEAHRQFVAEYQQHRVSAHREWETLARRLSSDPDGILAAVENSFPRPDKLEKTFGFDVNMFQISVPEKVSLELLTFGEQRAIVEARQLAAQQAGDKIHREVDQFVADCVASLREQTAVLCGEMLISIQFGKTDGVHQKTLNRLVKFIDQFKQMNFANDTVMEEQLNQVRQELLSHTAEEYRDDAVAQNRLKKGLRDLSMKARDLAREDATALVQRFGAMGRRKLHAA